MHADSLQPGMLVCHPILRSIIRKYSFVLFSQLKVWRIHTTNETCHNSARYSGSNLPFLASPRPSTNHIARDQHLEIAYSSWLLARQMQCKFCKIIFVVTLFIITHQGARHYITAKLHLTCGRGRDASRREEFPDFGCLRRIQNQTHQKKALN